MKLQEIRRKLHERIERQVQKNIQKRRLFADEKQEQPGTSDLNLGSNESQNSGHGDLVSSRGSRGGRGSPGGRGGGNSSGSSSSAGSGSSAVSVSSADSVRSSGSSSGMQSCISITIAPKRGRGRPRKIN